MDENSSFLKLPDIEEASYLVGLLSELGFVSSNGMGAVPMSWLEIDAWLRVTQLELSIWERLTMKEMSEVYAAELSKATVKNYPAPYIEHVEDVEIDRTAVANKLRSVFNSFKRNPKVEPETQD